MEHGYPKVMMSTKNTQEWGVVGPHWYLEIPVLAQKNIQKSQTEHQRTTLILFNPLIKVRYF